MADAAIYMDDPDFLDWLQKARRFLPKARQYFPDLFRESAATQRLRLRSTALPGSVLDIDRSQYRVCINLVEANLTPTEFDLLFYLGERPCVVMGRNQLLSEVWRWPGNPDQYHTRTMDSHVKAIRRKIGAKWIRTVPGIGYALEGVRENVNR